MSSINVPEQVGASATQDFFPSCKGEQSSVSLSLPLFESVSELLYALEWTDLDQKGSDNDPPNTTLE